MTNPLADAPAADAPFTDPSVVGGLYREDGRLRRRTDALHRAKRVGADATATITTLAAAVSLRPHTVVDIGCGRGTLTVALSLQYPGARLIAVDQSPAMLAATRQRVAAVRGRIAVLEGDFHDIALPPTSTDLATAAFCLYHSTRPVHALAGIARLLRPGGHLICVTKSADSYAAIDRVVADTGLDPEAESRPSLYRTFHSGNAEQAVSAAGLSLLRRVDQQHQFRFADAAHLADYLVTSPKYRLPTDLAADPSAIADRLRTRAGDASVDAVSTVTYLVVGAS